MNPPREQKLGRKYVLTTRLENIWVGRTKQGGTDESKVLKKKTVSAWDRQSPPNGTLTDCWWHWAMTGEIQRRGGGLVRAVVNVHHKRDSIAGHTSHYIMGNKSPY
jgi:hypothetical protein